MRKKQLCPVCTILSVLLPKSSEWKFFTVPTWYHDKKKTGISDRILRQTWSMKTRTRSEGDPLPIMSRNRNIITQHSPACIMPLCHFDRKLTVLRPGCTWVKLFITREETHTCLYIIVPVSHCCLVKCTYGLFSWSVLQHLMWTFIAFYRDLYCYIVL